MNEYTPTTGENDWKIVRNAATSTDFVMPMDFDRWFNSVKAEERERIEDIIDDEYADLVAAGHLNSQAQIMLGRILNRISGGQ